MFALVLSTAAIFAAISAVFYARQRSLQAVKRFQNEHKEQVEVLVVEVQECRDALKVMVSNVSRLDRNDDRLDDLSQARADRLKTLEGELTSLNDRVEQISKKVSLGLPPRRR